ncbi:hypothetical protein EV401DRAFT_1321642 [Pisolithus croceorrhizus]|nr:hypothetical protein EV401DRAFT_1321642 [Pisolithus croceorrhizus]
MAPQREMNLRVKGSSNGPPSAAGSSRHSSWLWLAPLSARNRFTQVSVALAPLALPDPLPKRAFIDSRQLLHPALWSDISWDTTRTATSSAPVPWDRFVCLILPRISNETVTLARCPKYAFPDCHRSPKGENYLSISMGSADTMRVWYRNSIH